MNGFLIRSIGPKPMPWLRGRGEENPGRVAVKSPMKWGDGSVWGGGVVNRWTRPLVAVLGNLSGGCRCHCHDVECGCHRRKRLALRQLTRPENEGWRKKKSTARYKSEAVRCIFLHFLLLLQLYFPACNKMANVCRGNQ